MRNYWKQTGLKFALPVMLVALLSCASAFSMADNHQTIEYKLKAAFLFNFSRFVTWPENAFQENGEFNLCILGSDPFRVLVQIISAGHELATSFGEPVRRAGVPGHRDGATVFNGDANDFRSATCIAAKFVRERGNQDRIR